ncbi:molecular chaperone, putative [Perkinsus marinus ATCC 50983]|uniref:Molecular chaperone, putative n=1 Tax=Perkinsus marinus (strain ATCC 50983 / TXsc) TaxID=423536 RepID=C5LBU4_PERM5|nr:molecular chaperone, putative [Perkinsus marinus ATCC 50983]EER05915.1 molecular chaperone, putative [Perkinsus marinus ATCC 50983]|eukprot:XP_002774099.1 molecular chaperone, putative [Perkinsus marinus ATCC 50983]
MSTSSSTTSAEPGKEAKTDDEFAHLMEMFEDEVNHLQTAKSKALHKRFAGKDNNDPNYQADRLTAKVFTSAYEVLLLDPTEEHTDKEIQKQYRRLSLLVHPDKCSHPKAAEAFQVLAKALKDINDPNYNDKYKEIIPHAKKRVLKRRKKENIERMRDGKDPLDLDGEDFNNDVMNECEKILEKEKEDEDYANNTAQANEERLHKGAKRAAEERLEASRAKKRWEQGRDARAMGWRMFETNIRTRRFQDKSTHNIEREREHRAERDGRAEGVPRGIDLSYKKNWR